MDKLTILERRLNRVAPDEVQIGIKYTDGRITHLSGLEAVMEAIRCIERKNIISFSGNSATVNLLYAISGVERKDD